MLHAKSSARGQFYFPKRILKSRRFCGVLSPCSRVPCPRGLWSNQSATRSQPRTRDFDQVFHLVSACFTWFQLSGKKCPTRKVSLTRTVCGDFDAFRCTLFHLVPLKPR